MEQQGVNRRQVLGMGMGMAAAGAGLAVTQPGIAHGSARTVTVDPVPRIEAGIAWYDVQQWGVEGRGWDDTEVYYDRFPARAKATVRPEVWNLSQQSAGMLTRFESDSRVFQARYTLRSPSLALPHMPATGVSGLDLYARDDDGRDRWLSVTKPTAQTVQAQLIGNVDPGRRLYTAYLPLYNGVTSLEIGVDAAAAFQPVAPRTRKPILFYGTSIMQGACASRPGMGMTAILGRRFDRPTINFGFSGNGEMESAVGALIAELDPAVYVIDCLPNMTADDVATRTEPLVRQLRAARPRTPILLVEDRTMTYARFVQSERDGHAGRRAALRRAYENLRHAGVRNLSYLEGEGLLGGDGEAATDGSHPSDLGMVRYADAYEKALRRLL